MGRYAWYESTICTAMFPFYNRLFLSMLLRVYLIFGKLLFSSADGGKFVMILGMSIIGYDLHALLTSPVKLMVVVGVIIVLWWIGKLVEKRLNLRVERDLRASSYVKKK